MAWSFNPFTGNLDIAGAGSSEVNSDAHWRVYNETDPTREVALDVSGVTTGTTRTLTVPDASGTIEYTGHKSKHATGGSDVLLPSDIGAATATHNHSHNALSGLQGGGSGDYYHLPAGTAGSQVPTWNATTGAWEAAAPSGIGMGKAIAAALIFGG